MTATETQVGEEGPVESLLTPAQVAEAQAKLAAEAEANAPPPTLASILDGALDRMDARATGTEKPIATPWADFNASLPGGGFWPGCHVLVAGTGVGKSTWALQLALHAARAGTPVAYVGLELDDAQIALRLVADVAKLRWSDLYTGEGVAKNDKDREKARAAADSLRALPFHVEHGSPMGWSATDLQSLAERMRRAHPGEAPMLLVLDFLQILGAEPHAGRQELRERIGRAAYVARQIARTHNAAVLVVSSLARGSYNAAELLEQAKPIAEVAKGIVAERRLLNPDAIVGLGKESGEIEYAADSVTVALRVRDLAADDFSRVLFALPKLRAGRETWCELMFNGARFADSRDHGRALADHLAKQKAPKPPAQTAKGSRSEAPEAKSSGDDDGGEEFFG